MRGITLGDILAGLEPVRPRPPDAKRRARTKTAKGKLPKNGNTLARGKLSDDDVILVRQLRAYGLSYREIRMKFDDRENRPSLTSLKDVCRGRRRVKVK